VNLLPAGATNDYRNHLPQEKAMSRKLILSLAAVATLAGAALISNNADAMVRSGRGSISVLRPIGQPSRPGNHWRIHEHRHFVHWHNHIWVRPVGYSVRAVEPGPCTCLTKNYTPEGMVVFQDLCTKESASTPVAGSSDAAQADAPANYAGQTYQDYLKANPQAAETKKN
jgi:hypothetical protein